MVRTTRVAAHENALHEATAGCSVRCSSSPLLHIPGTNFSLVVEGAPRVKRHSLLNAMSPIHGTDIRKMGLDGPDAPSPVQVAGTTEADCEDASSLTLPSPGLSTDVSVDVSSDEDSADELGAQSAMHADKIRAQSRLHEELDSKLEVRTADGGVDAVVS